MSDLSKLSLVKLHLEKVKEMSSSKFTSFTAHLIQKYGLDSVVDRDQQKPAGSLNTAGGQF